MCLSTPATLTFVMCYLRLERDTQVAEHRGERILSGTGVISIGEIANLVPGRVDCLGCHRCRRIKAGPLTALPAQPGDPACTDLKQAACVTAVLATKL